MKIEIWSDFVCPFCYIGKANLQQALAELAISDAVLTYRSFELDPAYPHDGANHHYDLLQQKYQLDAAAAKAKCDQLTAVGTSCGLNMDFEQAYYGNTFLAHQLQHFAQSVSTDAADAINNALFVASFEQGRPLNQMSTLLDIAAEQGLDVTAVKHSLETHEFAPQVRADEAAAAALQITGVPFFGFEGRLAVAGAQSIDAFKEVIQHIRNHSAADDALMLRQ